MDYEILFKKLNKGKIQYLVAGGLAANLYGVPRFTKDIDLIINLERKNILHASKILIALGYKPRVPVKIEDFAEEKNRTKWIKEKEMIVFSFVSKKPPFYEIDIFIDVPFNFKKVYLKKEIIKVGKLKIPLVPLDNLISMKRKAGRPKDLSDIKSLQIIRRERI